MRQRDIRFVRRRVKKLTKHVETLSADHSKALEGVRSDLLQITTQDRDFVQVEFSRLTDLLIACDDRMQAEFKRKADSEDGAAVAKAETQVSEISFSAAGSFDSRLADIEKRCEELAARMEDLSGSGREEQSKGTDQRFSDLEARIREIQPDPDLDRRFTDLEYMMTEFSLNNSARQGSLVSDGVVSLEQRFSDLEVRMGEIEVNNMEGQERCMQGILLLNEKEQVLSAVSKLEGGLNSQKVASAAIRQSSPDRPKDFPSDLENSLKLSRKMFSVKAPSVISKPAEPSSQLSHASIPLLTRVAATSPEKKLVSLPMSQSHGLLPRAQSTEALPGSSVNVAPGGYRRALSPMTLGGGNSLSSVPGTLSSKLSTISSGQLGQSLTSVPGRVFGSLQVAPATGIKRSGSSSASTISGYTQSFDTRLRASSTISASSSCITQEPRSYFTPGVPREGPARGGSSSASLASWQDMRSVGTLDNNEAKTAPSDASGTPAMISKSEITEPRVADFQVREISPAHERAPVVRRSSPAPSKAPQPLVQSS